jgi:hypothetical protein
VPAASLVLHPSYIASQVGNNDLALIKLIEAQPRRTRHDLHRLAVIPGATVTQVGFGSFAAPNTGSGVQRKLSTATVGCSLVGASGVDTSKVLCFDANDGNGTCFGDSGGPAFVQVGGDLRVAAVTSFGANNQCTGYDVATQVASGTAFIDQYVPKFTPVNTNGDGPPSDEEVSGGCSSQPSAAGLWLLALVAATLVRPRRLGARA